MMRRRKGGRRYERWLAGVGLFLLGMQQSVPAAALSQVPSSFSSSSSSSSSSFSSSTTYPREQLHWLSHMRGGIKRPSKPTTTTITTTTSNSGNIKKPNTPTITTTNMNEKKEGNDEKEGAVAAVSAATTPSISPAQADEEAGYGTAQEEEEDVGVEKEEKEEEAKTPTAEATSVEPLSPMEPLLESKTATRKQGRRQRKAEQSDGAVPEKVEGEQQEETTTAAVAAAAAAAAAEVEKEGGEGSGETKSGRQRPRRRRRRAPIPPPPPPERHPSPIEESLLETPAGRMTLALCLVLRELFHAYVPQLYCVLAFLIRFLAQHTTLLLRLGLVAEQGRMMSERERRERMRGKEGGRPGLLLEEEEEDEAEVLSAESLMPAPVDRFKRVSAAFLARHGLVDEGPEMDFAAGSGRRKGEEEGGREGGREGGASFTFSFKPGDVFGSGKSGVVGRSPALLRGREGGRGEGEGLKEGRRSEAGLRTRVKEGEREGSITSAAWKQLVPDFDVTEGAQALGKSLTSLTKGLKKGLLGGGGKSKKDRIKLPPRRRVLFDDDDDDDEDEGEGLGRLRGVGRGRKDSTGLAPRADRIGIPPRAQLLAEHQHQQSKPVTAAPSLGPTRESEATPRDSSPSVKRFRPSLKPSSSSSSSSPSTPLHARAADPATAKKKVTFSIEEDEEEDGGEDWLASLKRRGQGGNSGRPRGGRSQRQPASSSSSSPSSTTTTPSSFGSRRHRNLFDDDDDDDLESWVTSKNPSSSSSSFSSSSSSSSSASPSSPPTSSSFTSLFSSSDTRTNPSSRKPRTERFVRRVDQVTGGRFPGVSDTQAHAKEKVEELRRRTAMSWSVRKSAADRQRGQDNKA